MIDDYSEALIEVERALKAASKAALDKHWIMAEYHARNAAFWMRCAKRHFKAMQAAA